MSNCPDADAILTIGDALGWDVEDGLRHLQTCDDCRAQMDALRIAHAGFAESEAVDDAVLRRVTGAIDAVATREAERGQATNVLVQWLEPILAGVTALITVSSSRVPIDSVGAAALAVALGIGLLYAGRMIARRIPALQPSRVDG